MFTFTGWSEFKAEDREQRILNKNRIPQIARYITENEDGYLFSSITASYKCKVNFKPMHGQEEIGMLEMEMEEASFVVNDGQHRCEAIKSALKENPSLGEETISVLLFPYENKARVQQMFSDLNRFVAKTSRSLDILYDKRDPISKALLEACDRVPVFAGLVDKDAVSLPAGSKKLFTLTALYDATKELLKSQDDEDMYHAEIVDRIVGFWTTVSDAIPNWARVKNGTLSAVELRQETICAHSVVLRAIGTIGREQIEEDPDGWKTTIYGLSEIDWRKDNSDWENVCIVANSVVSNRQARVATQAYLKEQLGLELSDVEKRARGRLGAEVAA